jgi:enediyne biosynthesis protein E4
MSRMLDRATNWFSGRARRRCAKWRVTTFAAAVSVIPGLLVPGGGCGEEPPAATTGAAAAGPSAAAATSPQRAEWFVDVTERVGLDFVHRVSDPDGYFMPDSIGSGGALLDFDNDGRLDLLLLTNAGPKSTHTHRLYHQQPDGTFRDVSAGSGVDLSGYGMGAAAADVNNDGFIDLLIAEYGRVRLLLNDAGSGRFRDVTDAAGIANPAWALSAAFFDYNRDGRLDLVVANYLAYSESVRCAGLDGQPDYCSPLQFPPQIARLFRNDGAIDGSAAPRFTDVTNECGFGRAAGPGMAAVCADFTGDRRLDVLVANDAHPNHLWVGAADGTFAEEAVARGIAYNAAGAIQSNMGIGLGDVNGDGLLDAYITHLTVQGNVLWAGESGGLFRDATAASGLAAPAWRGTGFGAVIVDFDNDAWPDIAAVNGRISRAKLSAPDAQTARRLGKFAPYAERNQLFANAGSGRFVDASPSNPSFCGAPNVGRGLLYGDIDNDGGIDLIVSAVNEPAKVYRNVAPDRGHWLGVRAVDPRVGGRDDYGARVTVRRAGGDTRALAGVVCPSQGMYVSNDPRVHFGLGDATAVESIEVTWSDGTIEKFAPPDEVDRVVELSKGRGNAAATTAGGPDTAR